MAQSQLRTTANIHAGSGTRFRGLRYRRASFYPLRHRKKTGSPMVPVRLAYKSYEPIGGLDLALSPVLFLHGIGASKEYWGDIPQNVANATSRRTYALDARNHGESSWSDEFSFDLNACDLLHFLNSEKIPRAILVGHSMGGITVIKAALITPQKIEKIVVEDMYVKKIPPAMLRGTAIFCSLARRAIDTVPPHLDENGAKKFICAYVHDNLPKEVRKMRSQQSESGDNHILSVRRSSGRLSFRSNLEVIERAMGDPDALTAPLHGQYDGPACFIYGKLSHFKVYEEKENIKQYFPNAVFECVEDAAHTVHGECPLEFTDALLKFIS